MIARFVLAAAFAAALALFAPPVAAVDLSPSGIGQVLIFPYYTVNANQQTMLSIANTSSAVGKVVKVRFREAYNGRSALDFNLYLSPGDMWTANVFALADAGVAGDGAALFTTDRSCTDPALTASGELANGAGYVRFSAADYTGASADSGPDGDARTREGHIELILMSDVVPGSELAHDITHVNGVPPVCDAARLEHAAGYAAPTLDPVTGNAGTRAAGGLYGAASIVNVPSGVFYAYNADALAGFSYRSLYTLPGDAQPTLAAVNDRDDPNSATARMLVSGEPISATFPGTATGSRAVDAVSAVFAANFLDNEYSTSTNGSVGTDWVVTFPTRYLYVDAQPGGAISGAATAFVPFERTFAAGGSCLTLDFATRLVFDREENTTTPTGCGFSAGCPPPPSTQLLCLETNVIAFDLTGTQSVLGSALVSPDAVVKPIGAAGWFRYDLSQSGHQLAAAHNGDVFHGLPLSGFAAIKYVNGNIPIPAGIVLLSNYTGTYRHRATAVCTNGNGACP